MPTVSYRAAMKEMVADNPAMAAEMLEDAINTILAGDLDEGRLLLRQYVKATIGFKELARRTGKDDKNLMRSLSASGNPTATNLVSILRASLDAQGASVAASVTLNTGVTTHPQPSV